MNKVSKSFFMFAFIFCGVLQYPQSVEGQNITVEIRNCPKRGCKDVTKADRKYLNIDDSLTVAEIRLLIEKYFVMSIERRKLIAQSRSLQDDEVLSDIFDGDPKPLIVVS